MNRLARWVIRLYPAQWRQRYGDEVDALIADSGADARTVADLAKGGVRMQFTTWSFPKLTLTLGLAGLLLGAALSLLLPSQYTSKATMQIAPARIDAATPPLDPISNPLNEHILRIEEEVLSRAQLTSMAGKLNLFPDTPVDDAVERMRNSIQISFVAAPTKLRGRAAVFDIAFTYPDRYKAQQTVEALMSAFDEANMASAMRTTTEADRPAGPILVLDVANLPNAPFYPSRTVVLLAGFLVGVLIATLWRVIQRRGFIVRRFALVTMTLGAIGIITVIAGNRLDIIPYHYRSAATLRLNHGTSEQVAAISARALTPGYLSTVVNDPRFWLYRGEIHSMSRDEVLQLMRSHVQIIRNGNHDGEVFTIAFDYWDRYKARQTVEALTNRFRAVSAEMFPESAHALMDPPEIMDVLDTASLPTTPSKPHRFVIALAGGIIGVLFACLMALFHHRWAAPPRLAVNG